ncbi:MAG: hypothetical protein ACLP9K_09765 [Nitrososphaerales archaeon]|jgi:hypothetical protein
MASKGLTVAVIVFLLLSMAVFGFFAGSGYRGTSSTSSSSSSSSITTSTSTSSSSTKSSKLVGAFLYLWYGYDYTTSDWTGGFDTSHWNDSSTGIVSDKPIQGYYSMMNNDIISSQIVEMEQAGIDFAVISWWGWGVYNFSNPSLINQSAASIDSATLNLFKLVSSSFPTFKLSIMVDAFNKGSLSAQNYSYVYKYIDDHFYSKYPKIVLKNGTSGTPYLFWFNPLDPYGVSLNDSFVNEVVGNNPYVNVTFWRAPSEYLQGSQNQIVSNYEGNPSISSNGIVSIIPRYDDSGLFKHGGRSSYMQFDVSYSQGLYQAEWNYVLNHSSSVSMVLIYSWNEYHERSEIEPHYDNTSSSVSPFYLTDLTTYYASKFEGAPPKSGTLTFQGVGSDYNDALNFYASELNASLGLMSTTPKGTTIYLSDDQALDYNALLKLYNETGNSTALSLADQIKSSIQSYGGLYGHWNGAFVLFGHYPTPWNFSSGTDITIGTSGGYTIKSTIFNETMGPASTSHYADLEMYYAAYNMQVKNYATAEDAFISANSLWNGLGFVDKAYTSTYASYKLALDLIVWEMMDNTNQTKQFATQYTPVLNQVASIFLALQGSDGGVYTDYVVTNGLVQHAGQENGETTSLFILAAAGSPDPDTVTSTTSTTSTPTSSTTSSTTASTNSGCCSTSTTTYSSTTTTSSISTSTTLGSNNVYLYVGTVIVDLAVIAIAIQLDKWTS